MANEMNEFESSVVAPAGGNYAGMKAGATAPGAEMGLNLERLEEERPELVNALRELVRGYRMEGVAARRHEIRRIRQARMFWQGMQYAWWNPADMNWHLPYERRAKDDRELEEMPRYQFVTNFYQGFGLSFVALLSQDVPSVRFYPQSTQSLVDIGAARAASDVAELIERNNQVEQLLTSIGYFLWTDGKLGAYVRYVEDGQRFGFRDEEVLEAIEVPLGADVWVCPGCGKEVAAGDERGVGEGNQPDGDQRSANGDQEMLSADRLRSLRQKPSGQAFVAENDPQDDNDSSVNQDAGREERSLAAQTPLGMTDERRAAKWGTSRLEAGAAICPGCGAELGEKDLRRAERVMVPRVAGVRRVANGQEVISLAGGLELNTPVWANEMHEYPYLQWQAEVHRAKLKAAYPLAAEKIESAPSQDADDVYARVSRLSVEQGLPVLHPGDALMNLITFDRTWLRPWAFYSVEDEAVRRDLLTLFPDGCYVAFAGDVYCEARNEGMDDHWRVLHALPGDGQNRPSVGDSLVQVQERYNTLSNIQAETYEYGIPPIYADPQVLDFDSIGNQVSEPAAHFPARARPGQPLAAGFFQPAPAQVPPDMIRHQQDLIGPVAQFLTGLFPAVFGGNMEDVKTASGYALARDQAMGRLGLVWRRVKQFYADVMLLGVDCFRKNRPEAVEVPLLGPDGALDARMIRVADLKGNICVHPEADETFPRLKSQQRGVIQQLFAVQDPLIQADRLKRFDRAQGKRRSPQAMEKPQGSRTGPAREVNGMLTVAQLAPMKERDPYLYETLVKIVSAVNATSQNAGVDPATPSPAPAPIASLQVQAANGWFDLAITDPAPSRPGLFYFAESDVTSGFNSPRVYFLGASRNLYLQLGNQTLYWRAYSQYVGSLASTPVTFGTPPTAVVGGGASGPTPPTSSGSGTPANGKLRGGNGFGVPTGARVVKLSGT